MKRHLCRPITLLIVLCLSCDPVTAATFAPFPTAAQTIIYSQPFESQAFGLALINAPKIKPDQALIGKLVRVHLPYECGSNRSIADDFSLQQPLGNLLATRHQVEHGHFSVLRNPFRARYHPAPDSLDKPDSPNMANAIRVAIRLSRLSQLFSRVDYEVWRQTLGPASNTTLQAELVILEGYGLIAKHKSASQLLWEVHPVPRYLLSSNKQDIETFIAQLHNRLPIIDGVAALDYLGVPTPETLHSLRKQVFLVFAELLKPQFPQMSLNRLCDYFDLEPEWKFHLNKVDNRIWISLLHPDTASWNEDSDGIIAFSAEVFIVGGQVQKKPPQITLKFTQAAKDHRGLFEITIGSSKYSDKFKNNGIGFPFQRIEKVDPKHLRIHLTYHGYHTLPRNFRQGFRTSNGLFVEFPPPSISGVSQRDDREEGEKIDLENSRHRSSSRWLDGSFPNVWLGEPPLGRYRLTPYPVRSLLITSLTPAETIDTNPLEIFSASPKQNKVSLPASSKVKNAVKRREKLSIVPTNKADSKAVAFAKAHAGETLKESQVSLALKLDKSQSNLSRLFKKHDIKSSAIGGRPISEAGTKARAWLKTTAGRKWLALYKKGRAPKSAAQKAKEFGFKNGYALIKIINRIKVPQKVNRHKAQMIIFFLIQTGITLGLIKLMNVGGGEFGMAILIPGLFFPKFSTDVATPLDDRTHRHPLLQAA